MYGKYVNMTNYDNWLNHFACDDFNPDHRNVSKQLRKSLSLLICLLMLKYFNEMLSQNFFFLIKKKIIL